jgi:hypothetical protein
MDTNLLQSRSEWRLTDKLFHGTQGIQGLGIKEIQEERE